MENNNNSRIKLSSVLLIISACYLYMIACGIKNNFGIMLSSIVENTGLAFASVSFVLAVGQLCFGITQPIFGLVADKIGNKFTLIIGVICTAVGVALIPFCKSALSLMLVLGILLPGGIGAISFGMLMSTITPKLPESIRTTASGIVNASSGIGNTLLTPVISLTIAAGGLLLGMSVLTVLSIIMIPFTLIMFRNSGGQKETTVKEKADKTSTRELFKQASKNRDYIFITLSFFTCGFHMALITNHLPTQIATYGYSQAEVSGAFSIYGVATVIGALISGMLCSKLRMKNVLGSLYLLRPISFILFFMLPKSMPVICVYVFLLGFTGSSTVTPTSGICGKLFGPRGMSIFFSFAFLVHQIGSFLSAWLGGVCFEAMGNYTLIWIVDAVLSFSAAMLSYNVREKKIDAANIADANS